MTTRRDVLKGGTAALAALAARRSKAFPRGAASRGQTFDYYISTTGSDSNSGALAQPWALTALNTKWSTYGGKRVGIIAGTYDVVSILGGTYPTASGDYQIAAFEIQGGSASSSTYIASCDANGNYSPRTAILDGGISLAKSAVINGSIAAGTSSLTVNSVTSGAISSGLVLGGMDITGTGTSLSIVSGSGTAWTLNGEYSSSSTFTGTIELYTGSQANPVGVAVIGHNGVSGQALGYVTIDGLQVINAHVQGINIGRAQPIGAGNVPGIVIKNCYIANVADLLVGTNPAGILAQNMDGALIQNNYIANVSSRAIYSQGARANGVQVYWSHESILEYNTCVDSDGTMSGGLSYKDGNQYNNTQRYNFIYQPNSMYNGNGSYGGAETQSIGTDEDGVAGTYFDIHHNLCVTQGFTVPAIGGLSTDVFSCTQNYYNNTFVMLVPGSNGFEKWGLAQTINYYNNIIQMASGSSGSAGTRAGLFGVIDVSTNVFDYNMYPTSPTLSLSTETNYTTYTQYSGLSNWSAALASRNPSGIGNDTHSVAVSDSQYGGTTTIFAGDTATDPASFKIVSGAPGSATGSNPGSSNGRTSGTAIDMGCWGGIDVNTGLPIAQIGASFKPA